MSDLTEKVRTRKEYSGVLVKAALVRTPTGVNVSTALAVAYKETMPERATHEYGPLILEDKWYSSAEFVQWIATLGKAEKFQASKEEFSVKGTWMPSSTMEGLYVPSNYGYMKFDWPSNLYRFMFNQNIVNLPSEISSPIDLPLFPNGMEATEWWFDVGEMFRLDLLGKVTVLLPNYKAKFRDIEIGSNRVAFSIDRLDKDANLLVRLFMKDQKTKKAWSNDLVVNGDGGKFETPSEFSYMRLVLTDQKAGETLDYRDVYPTWGALPEGVRREPSAEDILETIRRGEKEDVEFKENLTNPDDIVKTVVAMANTKGGALFIGVNNDGQVVAQKEDPTVIGEKIRNWVRDWCEQSVRLEVKTEKVLDQDILIVLVEQSTNKPCWFRGKGAFIRYGASNRHATRAEVEQMLRKESFGMSVTPMFA